MDDVYEKILNMTNKEAAAVIKNVICNQVVARANGKTILVATINQALFKAIVALENMPDSDSEALSYASKLCDALYLED